MDRYIPNLRRQEPPGRPLVQHSHWGPFQVSKDIPNVKVFIRCHTLRLSQNHLSPKCIHKLFGTKEDPCIQVELTQLSVPNIFGLPDTLDFIIDALGNLPEAPEAKMSIFVSEPLHESLGPTVHSLKRGEKTTKIKSSGRFPEPVSQVRYISNF